MIRNIIWDVDGTLFDTYPSFAKSFQLAIKDSGQDVPQDWIIEQARISIDYCVKTLAARCQLEEDFVGEKFGYHYSHSSPLDQPPFDGVIAICKYITESGGKNLIVTHRHSSGLIQLLDTFNMKGYFSGWTTADDGYKKKPDPEAFLITIDNHNLNLDETLTIGDRDIDILAGQAAGIRACLFGEPVTTCQPDLVFKDFNHLLDWVKQLR